MARPLEWMRRVGGLAGGMCGHSAPSRSPPMLLPRRRQPQSPTAEQPNRDRQLRFTVSALSSDVAPASGTGVQRVPLQPPSTANRTPAMSLHAEKRFTGCISRFHLIDLPTVSAREFGRASPIRSPGCSTSASPYSPNRPLADDQSATRHQQKRAGRPRGRPARELQVRRVTAGGFRPPRSSTGRYPYR